LEPTTRDLGGSHALFSKTAKIAAVMARTRNDRPRIADAGAEIGAKMLGALIACSTLIRGRKAHANR
jgi:hypothetical protein